MESLPKFSQIQKKPHFYFDFYINELKNISENNTFINDFLGYPNLPLIGIYGKSEYKIGTIMSLATFQFNICQGKEKKDVIYPYSDLNLPKNIINYLNINEEINIDNNSKKKKKVVFKPKEKINFYFIITDIPEGKDEVNLIPQMYYLKGATPFSDNNTRQVFEKPISLFDNENSLEYDVETKYGKNEIDINNLRLEYSSIHLKSGALSFSPNNLRFELKRKNNFSQFFLVITDETNDFHSVFYYITCNNKQCKEKMTNILKESKTIEDLCIKILKEYNQEKNIWGNIKNIFGINI